jgi:hypothetical protein
MVLKIIFPPSPFYFSRFFRSHETRFMNADTRTKNGIHIQNITKNDQKCCMPIVFAIQE